MVLTQIATAEPVPTQAMSVDPLELGDPPRGAGGHLLVEHSIFVDIDGLRREAILLLRGNKPTISRYQISSATFHVPGVLVRNAAIGGCERGPFLPPGIRGQGLTSRGRPGEEHIGSILGTAT